MTDLRRAEKERDRLLTAERAARAEAEAGSRTKDEFLAMLAHELRNPLGVILNGVRILDSIGSPEPDAARVRGVMTRQTQHLGRLLGDLLDVARISQGKIELRREVIDLRAVVDFVLEAERHRLVLKSQHLDVTMPKTPVFVYGDPARLQQVIGNLIHNASKYTPEHGRVAVTIEQRDDEAVARVSDTGAGIPADQLTAVFGLFTQLDRSPDRIQEGLGIGLTLVQRLVKQHGGRVEARSEGLGCGSEFIVTLPLAPVAEPTSSFVPPAPARRKFHLLIIEDNADARELLKFGLGLAGHHVDVAADGSEGVARAIALHPDVAVVDLGLPGMDGFSVARALRAKFGPSIRLVALTGYGQSDDRRRTREAGFDAHITKPASVEDVLAALPV